VKIVKREPTAPRGVPGDGRTRERRVIHVITRLILGGAQENTLLTVEGLDRIPGYRTTLVTGPAIGPEGDLVERAARGGVDLVIIPELRRAIHPGLDAAAFARLVRIFRRERPDIVHTHSSKAGILGRVAARVAGVPTVFHTIHGLPFHPYQGRLSNALFITLERLAAKCCDRLISVADAMTDQAAAAGVAPRGKFVTIYSGMEVEPFLREDEAGRHRVRAAFGIRADEIVIGKIARLFELKGHEDVLRAAPIVLERFPQVRFLFVGDGILRDKLGRLAAEMGIADRVVFAGLVPPDRIPDMIQAMDVLVHASLREGLARVLPQALLSGKPVISYDVDGAREVIIDGETGFLVAPRSIVGLAEAMLRMLSAPDRGRRMAQRGRELFADQFRAETMVRRIHEEYQRIEAKL